MTEYVIEKGVEYQRKMFTGARKYPFEDMEITDSFFVECEPEEAGATANRLRNAAHRFSLSSPSKFSIRHVPGGVRVWRIA